MSVINDYEIRLLAADRQHELQAEAAEYRLARHVRAARPGWVQRLGHGWQRLVGARAADGSVGLRPRHGH